MNKYTFYNRTYGTVRHAAVASNHAKVDTTCQLHLKLNHNKTSPE